MRSTNLIVGEASFPGHDFVEEEQVPVFSNLINTGDSRASGTSGTKSTVRSSFMLTNNAIIARQAAAYFSFSVLISLHN